MWLVILPDLPLFYWTCPGGPTLLGKNVKGLNVYMYSHVWPSGSEIRTFMTLCEKIVWKILIIDFLFHALTPGHTKLTKKQYH